VRQNLLIAGDLELLVFLSFPKLGEIKEHLGLVIDGVLTVMSPVVLLEIYLFDVVFEIDSESVQLILLDEEVGIFVEALIQLPLLHDLGHESVVEVPVQQVVADQGLHRHVRGNHVHASLRLQKSFD